MEKEIRDRIKDLEDKKSRINPAYQLEVELINQDILLLLNLLRALYGE